jgi:hypothetical protein
MCFTRAISYVTLFQYYIQVAVIRNKWWTLREL